MERRLLSPKAESRPEPAPRAVVAPPPQNVAAPAAPTAAPAPATAIPEPGEEEAAPSWPGEADEVSFLAEARHRGESDVTAPPPMSDREAEDRENLPPLEGQVARVPAELRATLDDLFRARFTRVTRVKALGGPGVAERVSVSLPVRDAP